MTALNAAARSAACFLVLSMAAPLPYAQDAKPATTAPSTPSQSPASQNTAPTTLHVDVNVVSMAVTVRDKHGKIVPNLTKDDFTLQDDNHPQTIKYFNQDQNLPLTMGLLVDTSGSLRDALNDERNASQKFFDQMLTQKQDKAFLVQFDREVDLLADPTSNRETLQRALDHLASPQYDRPSNSGSGSDSSSNDPDQNSGDNNSHNRRAGNGGGTMLYDAIYLASDELMSKEKGRKALIVLTDGEDRGSKETLHTAIEAAQRADTVVYAMYFKGEQHNNNNGGNNGGHHGGMGWPGGGGGWPGGGGGYPGGGGGGYPGGGGGGQRQEKSSVDGKKVMEQICAETGGRMFEVKKKENFDEIYAQIAEELRSQYVLGYTPDKSVAGGGYHRITLLPKKKDDIVQTRQGYYSQD